MPSHAPKPSELPADNDDTVKVDMRRLIKDRPTLMAELDSFGADLDDEVSIEYDDQRSDAELTSTEVLDLLNLKKE